LGLLCAPAPVAADATPLKGRLDNEEKIDSFGFWLFRRGARINRLKYGTTKNKASFSSTKTNKKSKNLQQWRQILPCQFLFIF
jgi:hypothetical protein